MNSVASPKRRISQQYYEEKAPVSLTPRDQVLSRVERILAEQFIIPFPGDDDLGEVDSVEMINLEAIVEVAKLPPIMRPSRPERQTKLDNQEAVAFTPQAVPETQELEEKTEAPTKRISLVASLAQIFIMGFIISGIFIFGILVGRGNVWESGLGYDLVVWLETKAGWTSQSTPEIVVGNSIPKTSANPGTSPLPGTTDSKLQAVAPPVQVATIALPPKTPEISSTLAVALEQHTLVAKASQDWSGSVWFKESAPPTSTPQKVLTEQATIPVVSTDTPAEKVTLANKSQPNKATTTTPVVTAPATNTATNTATVAPVADDGKFAVQVAMVQDEAQAKKGVEKLENSDFTAYYYRHTNGWWALRVGHFTSYQEARTAQAKLTQMGYNNPYISRMNN